MPVTDQISDFLTRIRNAGRAGHKTVTAPASKLKIAIARILKDQGFIADYAIIEDKVQNQIKVTLKYYNREPAIREMKRISKPGRRIYVSVDNLPRIKNGLGIAIISTSKGVLTDKDAKKFNVGGEFICSIW
ncbi:MAG TPA: 30S ribosomal protein S8 [Candidatus Kapabacteria bacterium]|nr:30S ribosomal protein S8 [Candidatus Kapabacteria bacterium]HOM05499.1 30S ribosomal protein S8 [Candidatus Kapabacteria bacterium]HPU22677.1 30S ribosomal protein S8 [Candidatus Kapabacteria bacterium]